MFSSAAIPIVGCAALVLQRSCRVGKRRGDKVPFALADGSLLASVERVKIRALTLDFGGTLDGSDNWRERFWRLYRSAGLVLDRGAFEQAFAWATRAAYAEPALRTVGLEELVRYQVEQQCRLLQLRVTPAVTHIVLRFVAESQDALQRHAPLLLRWRRQVRLGVISNFYGNLPVILAQLGLASLFDLVVDSTLAGVRKPEPAIFELACRELGCRPEEVLHVGDSLEHDVRGARNAGLQAAWLSSAVAQPTMPLPGGVVSIDTLAALEEYLPCKLQ